MPKFERILKDNTVMLSELQQIDGGITDVKCTDIFFTITTTTETLTDDQKSQIAGYNTTTMVVCD